jgi:two-component system, chemotaxis family, sensor kinase CheA
MSLGEPSAKTSVTARGAATAMREIAVRLFTHDAEPPYSVLAAALPQAAEELESISRQTHEASLAEVGDAAAVLGQMAREAASRDALHDHDALELAEAFDRACALVESLAAQIEEASLQHERDATGVRVEGTLPAWARPASNPVPTVLAPDLADAAEPSAAAPTHEELHETPAVEATQIASATEQETGDAFAVEQAPACEIGAETDLSPETTQAFAVTESDASAPASDAFEAESAQAPTTTASEAVFDVLEMDTDSGMRALRETPASMSEPAAPVDELDVVASTSEPAASVDEPEPTPSMTTGGDEHEAQPALEGFTPDMNASPLQEVQEVAAEMTAEAQALMMAAAQALTEVSATSSAPAVASAAVSEVEEPLDVAALMAQMSAGASAADEGTTETPGAASDDARVDAAAYADATLQVASGFIEPDGTDAGEVDAGQVEASELEMAEAEAHAAIAADADAPTDAMSSDTMAADPVASADAAPMSAPVCDPPSAASDDDATAWAELDVSATSGTAFESPPMFNPDTASLVPFMADDLRALADRLGAVAAQLAGGDTSTVGTSLPEIAGELSKTSVFFDLHDIARAAKLTAALVANLGASVPLDVAAHRVRVIERLARRDAESLSPSVTTTPGDAATAPGSDAIAAGAPTADGSTSAASATGAMNVDTPTGELTPEQVAMLLAAEDQASTWGTTPLMLPPDKADLLQFLVTDVKEAAEQITPLIGDIGNIAMRPDIGTELVRLAEQMTRTSASFEFRSLNELLRLLGDIGIGLAEVSEPLIPELEVRLKGVQSLISQHATALEVAMESTWPLGTLTRRVHRLLDGQGLSPTILNWHKGDPERVLELDGVVEGVEPSPRVSPEEDHSDWQRPAAVASATGTTGATTEATESSSTSALGKGADHVRIESSVIDDLLETVGELVQHKGRIQMLVDELRRESPSERVAELWRTTESMDRFLGVLQSGIMGTRLQAMNKLFDRYPRIVRDVARLADKEIDIKIAGGDTLVDKNLLEALSDPLTAILRNIAARLVESKEIRTRRGKPEIATIRLSARHQGSQVVVSIEDDGGGFDRDDTIRQAQAASLLTAEQAASLPDAELFMLLFQPDLAGSPLSRVGPAVSELLGGSIQVSSSAGRGSRVDLTVPMKSAILSAVIVAAGNSVYTVPLQGVREITRLEPDRRRSVGGQPCLVLREHVIPLLDSRELFGDDMSREPTIALIITDGQTEAALAVDRVLSKQEVAIRHIEESELRRGPFSGTSLTQQGEVSLVLDVQRILGGLNAVSSRNHTNAG